MAIKVNGTTVINDSRALTNIASVDATTVAALGAAGVGGGGGAPSPPNWSSATVTKNSTGSWSKPASIGDDDWVFFYGVGGGGSASENSNIVGGGGGGGAFVVALQGAAIPSSVSFVIGAGGDYNASNVPQDGGDTTLTVDGVVFTADGGGIGNWGSGAKSNNGGSGEFFYPYSSADVSMLGAIVRGGRAAWDTGAATGSTFGGGGGGMAQYQRPAGGVSTYAGNGGVGANGNGVFPGGGAGSGNYYVFSTGSGAAGQLRIYYG